MDRGDKVTSRHLSRAAYLYVRQSTLRQVMEHQESTRRQYALKERAIALGWPLDQIVVIDEDLGHSGAASEGRTGFQRLVADVGMGKVGIVLGLEVSRLARSFSDWYRLLGLCAMSEALILDEDGVYDPGSFNDRLLLGLKGTMSEAELHFLRARMQGGILNKARRGELPLRLPIGLVYEPGGRVALDPDRQVQDTVRLFFATFQRLGAATAVVREFRSRGIGFPNRFRHGSRKGEVFFAPLSHNHALQTLKNPRYAGAFVYGRRRERTRADGKLQMEFVPREQWTVFLPDSHVGYITWEEYEDNLRRLHQNAQARGADRRGPPREGPALLQGLVICGLCGRRMTVRYRRERRRTVTIYVCQRDAVEQGGLRLCQSLVGTTVDDAAADLVLEAVSPLALETVLKVQEELAAQGVQVERIWQDKLERTRYEADLARRRFMQVDPGNRLVASTLEAEWNAKLRAVAEAEEEYERQSRARAQAVDDALRERARALAEDLPRLWRDPATPSRERKRMVRLVIEDVTLVRQDRRVRMQVRFRGGSTRVLDVALSRPAHEIYRTPAALVEALDHLLDSHTERECADLLNARGLRPGRGEVVTVGSVIQIRTAYGLRSHADRLRAKGLMNAAELAAQLGVTKQTVHVWHRRGLLTAYPMRRGGQRWLFGPPPPDLPAKYSHKRRSAHIDDTALIGAVAGAGPVLRNTGGSTNGEQR